MMSYNKNKAPGKDWAEEILKWVQTKDGEEKLAAAINKSDVAINEIKKSIVINDKMLHSSFNF